MDSAAGAVILCRVSIAWGPGVVCRALQEVFCIAHEDHSYLRMFTMIMTNMDFKPRYYLTSCVSGVGCDDRCFTWKAS